MGWEQSTFTRGGLALISQCLNEGKALEIVAAPYGSGVTPASQLADLTDLSGVRGNMILADIGDTADNSKLLAMEITSQGVTEAFQLRQIGVYARAGSAGTPKLLFVMQDETGLTIPTQGEQPNFVLTVRALLGASLPADTVIRQELQITVRDGAVTLAKLGTDVKGKFEALEEADALLETRIDEIIAPSGEAPSAAEVTDARIGYDATVFPTLGEAVRGQVEGLKEAAGKEIPLAMAYRYALDNRCVRPTTGAKASADGLCVTNFIPLNKAQTIRYRRLVVTAASPAHGMAFFSAANTSAFVSGIASQGGASEAGSAWYEVPVPEGATHAQFTWWGEAQRAVQGDFGLYDAQQYSSSAQEVKNRELEETLDGISTMLEPVGFACRYADEGKAVNAKYGSKYAAEPFCITNFVPLGGVSKIAYSRMKVTAASPAHGMAFFSSPNSDDYISGIASRGGMGSSGSEICVADVPEGAAYAQFTWWGEAQRATLGEFALYDGEQYEAALATRVSELEARISNGGSETALVADVPQSEGVQNAILTARQFTDIRWTPVADMPGIYRDPATQAISYRTHKKGVRQRGIPYCSGNTYEQRVNDSISFDAFATAVKSADSLLYTENDYYDGAKKACYYGVACSKLVQACWGAPQFVDSQKIETLPGLEKIALPGEFTVDDLQLGDGILNPQVHCTIVTGINRNTKGEVVSVEISEAVMPTCRRLTWTKGEFYEHFASYGLYRYPQIVSAKYRKARYIDLGDGITAPEDIPIAIKRGSYINISGSASRKAVVDNTRWTTLHDVVDGVDVTRAITAAEITLPNNRPGYHEIYPTDAEGRRGNSSYYFVYTSTVSASVSGGSVTVEYSANAPAVLIYFSSSQYTRITSDTGAVTAAIPDGATSCKILFRSEYGTFFSRAMDLA